MRPRSERLISFYGWSLLPAQWGVLTGIPKSAIAQRIARGWDPVRAITTLQYGLPGLPRAIAEIMSGKSPDEVLLQLGKDWRGRPLHPDYVREARARIALAARRQRPPRRAPATGSGSDREDDFFPTDEAGSDPENDPKSTTR